MVRWVRSPGLGMVRVYDGAHEPRLAPWCPAFHVDEVAALRGCKRAGVAEWQAAAMAKAVFPGAVVVECVDLVARRQRYERLWARNSFSRRGSTPPPMPDPTEDES